MQNKAMQKDRLSSPKKGCPAYLFALNSICENKKKAKFVSLDTNSDIIWRTPLPGLLGAAGTQTQETPNRTKGLILYKPCAARAPTPDSRARRAARLYSPCGKAAGELYKIKILYNQVEIFFKILQKYSGRSAKKHIRFKVLG